MRHGTFTTEPPGFEGMMIVAKHHPQHQIELLGLLGGVDAKSLGFWVVKGWNQILTEKTAIEQFDVLLRRWEEQNDNPTLKRTAGQARKTARKETH